jgi:hypothetical protein
MFGIAQQYFRSAEPCEESEMTPGPMTLAAIEELIIKCHRGENQEWSGSHGAGWPPPEVCLGRAPTDTVTPFEFNHGMQNNQKSVPVLVPELIKGQLWQFNARCIQIGHVGRLLVEHRGVSLLKRRCEGRVSMTAIKDLQKCLTANRAVLLANSLC